MSKRFGRNQKRRYREQVAELTRAHELDQGLLRYQRQKIDDYERWETRLNRVVPKYSALKKDVAVVSRRDDPGDRDYLSVVEPLRAQNLRVDAPIYDHDMKIQRLHMNVIRVEAYPEQFNHGMRYELRVGNGERVMFAIDDAMIQAKDYDDNFVEYVSHEISQIMVDHLKQS
jgi:hypothetical protein